MGDDASKRLPEINAQMLAIKTVNEDIASLEADLALVTDKQATLRAKLSVLDVEEKEKSSLLVQARSALKKLSEHTDSLWTYCSYISKALPAQPEGGCALFKIIEGPTDEEATILPDIACARCVSTYPSTSTGKQGDPVCDRFQIHVYEGGRTLFCIADGCNWGMKAREAAYVASNRFVNTLSELQGTVTSVRDAGVALLQALAAAHNDIIRNKSEAWLVGTTTLLGGFLLPIVNSRNTSDEAPSKKSRITALVSSKHKQEPKDSGKDDTEELYACILIGVGDCKVRILSISPVITPQAFHWSASEHRGNRGNINDARDPGGRLGPFLEDGYPDLRNVNFFYQECGANDLIVCVSDGVHDNLSPEMLGVLPGDLCQKFDKMSWDEASKCNKHLANELRETYMASKLEEIIFSEGGPTAFLHDSMLSKDMSPTYTANKIIDYCVSLTKNCRDYMESNPEKKQPTDYKLYPGKMDHTTCVVVRVGTFTPTPGSKQSSLKNIPAIVMPPAGSPDTKTPIGTPAIETKAAPQPTSPRPIESKPEQSPTPVNTSTSSCSPPTDTTKPSTEQNQSSPSPASNRPTLARSRKTIAPTSPLALAQAQQQTGANSP